MLKLALSDMDLDVVDEVVHRLGVLCPATNISLDGNDLVADSAADIPELELKQLIHDQFLQCRLARQTAGFRARLYERLLK
jgi:hypothetical protein